MSHKLPYKYVSIIGRCLTYLHFKLKAFKKRPITLAETHNEDW